LGRDNIQDFKYRKQAILPLYRKENRINKNTKEIYMSKKVFLLKGLLVPLLFSAISLFSSQEAEKAFSDIYKNKVWGTLPSGEGSSGEGSCIGNAIDYLNFLQEFINTHHIRTIVDIGCGDWELSKQLDLSNIEYFGIDVVKSLIERNQSLYKDPNLHFIYADAADISLPEADLLICKDVLQHLSYVKIFQLLAKFSSFPYCLITNDISRWKTNQDIACGDYRPLNLFASPFNLTGEIALVYHSKYNTKQVVLLKK
jgi:SAM-dependent methyltransferase